MADMVSTVPAVLDALVALWSAALPDVQVVDGQPLDLEDDVICVGFSGAAGEVSVTDTRTQEQMASSPDREQYDVTNMFSSWRGAESNAKAVRDGVYALVRAAAAEIARDQRLGGLVMRANVSSGNFTQYQSTDGATAVVQVIVSIDAFTGR
jgi:hypothetical protein